ncbi:MAG TPA: heme biosynthesis HemY N-terminal domain-containing protein [Burkholderiaceae bacterium]|nr:heme biosynthesis HemY N-terminal domain-containing protein [Burkholderiaceae bacterium]
MRNVIWFVLLFGVAVLAASALGTNDGLVTFYWRGWRVDVSLNLFLLGLLGSCFVIVTAIQALSALVGLPRRAHEWRVARRDRSAQAALRDALAQYFGGRYSRAQKSAQRALVIQADTPELAQDNEFTVLSHLLAAGSAHRLQDRPARDEQLRHALDLSRRSAAARSAEEGARLLAAEWALDDRDATRALALLGELPQGVARRTHALRLRLQATRLGRQPQEALKTARLLAKHQGFSKIAAQGLLRSLAFESLDTAHDIDQLKRVWGQFEPVDRRDAFVAARAADRAAALGAFDDARGWLRPFWEQSTELGADERAAVALGLVSAMRGIGLEWLPRLEAAASAYSREGAVALAVGCALAERQLWGKARRLLEQAAADGALANAPRRKAWLMLAELARQEGDAARAAVCFEAAARLG